MITLEVLKTALVFLDTQMQTAVISVFNATQASSSLKTATPHVLVARSMLTHRVWLPRRVLATQVTLVLTMARVQRVAYLRTRIPRDLQHVLFAPTANTLRLRVQQLATATGVSKARALLGQFSRFPLAVTTADHALGGLSKVSTLTQKKRTTAVQCIITNIAICTCGIMVPAALLQILR